MPLESGHPKAKKTEHAQGSGLTRLRPPGNDPKLEGASNEQPD